MKALTSASAAGLPLGTQTAVLELRNASSRMREPGIVPTRPDSDSRESAIASILPSRMAATGVDSRKIDMGRFGCRFLRSAEGRGIRDAAYTDPLCIGVVD